MSALREQEQIEQSNDRTELCLIGNMQLDCDTSLALANLLTSSGYQASACLIDGFIRDQAMMTLHLHANYVWVVRFGALGPPIDRGT